MCLDHLLSPGYLVFQVHHESTVSGVLCVSSGELISGCDPPGDVNHLESQEDMVNNWEPAYSLVEDAGLWSQYWSSPLPSTSGCQTTASLPLAGEGPVCSWLALLWYLLNPLFCEWARLQLEPFAEEFSLFLFFLSLVIPQFGLLSHVSRFRLSSGHSAPILP